MELLECNAAATYFNGGSSGFFTGNTDFNVSIHASHGILTNGTFIATSDKRVKENITELHHSLDLIGRLRPVSYNKIDRVSYGDRLNYGFIAQEVEEVIPVAVNTGKGEVPVLQPFEKVSFEDGVSYTLLVKNGDDIKEQTYTKGDARPEGEIIVKSKTGGRVFGNSGSITATCILDGSSSRLTENVGGLGAEITTSADMGETTVTRGHTAQTGNGQAGILRYYDITPTNNESLDATLVFHYNDEDISGFSESDLSLWRSEDEGNNWSLEGGIVTTSNNTITLSNIDSFSRWTASDGENPLPITLSSFTSQFVNGSAVLQWITLSEFNNLGWSVYRSYSDDLAEASLLNYELIPGAGTTSEITEYTYEDLSDFSPTTTYWYWLENVEANGETSQYGPISLTTPEEPEDPQTPDIPVEFGLYQNYPNPFNPETKISFALKEAGDCELFIYNIKGEKVRQLFQGSTEENRIYNFSWDGKDNAGKEVNSGMYFYQIKAGKYTETKKMLLLR